jgi:hypothetical protein
MEGVLVLNFDFTPLNVTSVRRGFILVDKGKAEIVKSDDNPISTGYKTYIRPVIIRLLNYNKHTHGYLFYKYGFYLPLILEKNV